MGKYAPLGVFLRRWRRKNGDHKAVELSFAEIERIIGALLPRAAATTIWWTNASSNDRTNVQCRSWLNADYDAHPLEGLDRVRFHPRKADREEEH